MSAPVALTAEGAVRRRSVLIADGYPAVLAWAARAFRNAGWSVVTADDGGAALVMWEQARAEGRAVDLVLCDLDLPVLTGELLAQELLSRDAHLAVILLSGYADFGEQWLATHLPRSAFFRKPVPAQELLAAADQLTLREPTQT